jgi:hypothetical protein
MVMDREGRSICCYGWMCIVDDDRVMMHAKHGSTRDDPGNVLTQI